MSEEQTNEFAKLDVLGEVFRKDFDQAQKDRFPYEQRWMKALRMYNGEIEPADLAGMSKEQSRAFIRLARIKVNAIDARMFDMLYPSGTENNWSIKPTPNPDVPDEVVGAIAKIYAEAGKELDQDELDKSVMEWASSKAEAVSSTIKDYLVEGRYRKNGRKVIHSGNLYGTGWLKGVYTDIKRSMAWQITENGPERKSIAEDRPGFSFVSIWDVYPEMTVQSSDIEQCGAIFQRHIMSKHDLAELAKDGEFNGEAIKDILKQSPGGNAKAAPHEVEQRASGNGEKESQSNLLKDKYEMLERSGWIQVDKLRECGFEVDDEIDELESVYAVVFMLGSRVVRASVLPAEREQQHIYHKYHFEEDETSLFGYGVCDVIADTADLANRAIRAAIDNAAMSAGPQLEVNLDALDATAVPGANQMTPFKVWLRRGLGDDARHRAVHAIDIPSQVGELIGLFNLFKTLNDEVSNIPSYMHGEGDTGAASTVGGLSMLMGAANITIKDVVANFDEGIVEPFITSMYDWVMTFGDDELKGDVKIKATGSTSLVAREVRNNALSQFAQGTANQEDRPYVKRHKLLAEQVKGLELPDDVLITEDEAQELQQEIKQMAVQMAAQMMAQSAMQSGEQQ